MPKEKGTVSFVLQERELSSVDEKGQRRIVPGEVKVWIGGGQPIAQSGLTKPAGVSTSFKLARETTLPD